MTWINPPTDFVDEYERDHFELVQDVAIEFWNRVTLRTPVDEGTAQGNWTMTFEQPSDTIYRDTALKRPQKHKPIPYPVFYVQNALEYIVPLEFGHSKIQAPAGMFRITLAELK